MPLVTAFVLPGRVSEVDASSGSVLVNHGADSVFYGTDKNVTSVGGYAELAAAASVTLSGKQWLAVADDSDAARVTLLPLDEEAGIESVRGASDSALLSDTFDGTLSPGGVVTLPGLDLGPAAWVVASNFRLTVVAWDPGASGATAFYVGLTDMGMWDQTPLNLMSFPQMGFGVDPYTTADLPISNPDQNAFPGTFASPGPVGAPPGAAPCSFLASFEMYDQDAVEITDPTASAHIELVGHLLVVPAVSSYVTP